MKIVRKYEDYNDYVDHQKEKTLDPVRRKKWLNQEWQEKITMFSSLFNRRNEYIKDCGKALCLCARTGQEVVALKSMEIDAVGIDLVECPPHVIKGDIHDMDFPDDSFGFVFCNSFDHSLYPDKFLSEIQRVLKPGGYGMLHLQLTESVDQYAENIIVSSNPIIEKLDKSEIIINESLSGVPHATYHWEVIFKKC